MPATPEEEIQIWKDNCKITNNALVKATKENDELKRQLTLAQIDKDTAKSEVDTLINIIEQFMSKVFNWNKYERITDAKIPEEKTNS